MSDEQPEPATRASARSASDAVGLPAAVWAAWLTFAVLELGGRVTGYCFGFVAAACLFLHFARASVGRAPSACRTVAPSTRSTWILLPIVLAGAPAAVAVYVMPILRLYEFLPVPQLFCGTVFGVLPLTVAAWLRSRWASRDEMVMWWRSAGCLLACLAAWPSTIGLNILFLFAYPWLEYDRATAEVDHEPRHEVRAGIWQLESVGYTVDMAHMEVYFAAEQCSGSQYGSEMCFARGGGAGFYLPPPNAREPNLNQSADGPLLGGWRWYVDD